MQIPVRKISIFNLGNRKSNKPTYTQIKDRKRPSLNLGNRKSNRKKEPSMELGEEDILSHTIQMLADDHKKENHDNNKKRPHSIHMVPWVFRELSPDSFNPRVVSIGPLHREDANLKGFEASKVKYVYSLFARLADSPVDQTLKACLRKVNASIDQVRECYTDFGETALCSDVELAQMMVVDACFILELILRCLGFEGSTSRNLVLTPNLIYDLVLLENQIPFFVLKDVYECTIMKFLPRETLKNFIFPFLNFFNLFEQDLKNTDNIDIDDIDHILGLLHKCYRPAHDHDVSFKNHTAQELEKAVRFKNHTAQELDRAGVNFKLIQYAATDHWPLAIKVESSRFPSISWCFGMPTLKMPLFCINDFTELILRNIIAYEQCSGVPSYVASYAAFMDMLVNTQDDIASLVEWGVIDNSLGSNKEAANMINGICKEVVLVDSPYSQQLEKLDKYYNGYWPKNIARLRRRYFSSPWNFIALVAAISLFTLTVIQTIKAF